VNVRRRQEKPDESNAIEPWKIEDITKKLEELVADVHPGVWH
jgi:hypothetical protein